MWTRIKIDSCHVQVNYKRLPLVQIYHYLCFSEDRRVNGLFPVLMATQVTYSAPLVLTSPTARFTSPIISFLKHLFR